MTETRITVDSVIDKDHVRVLISTDGKTEKPVIMEKKALKELVKGTKEFFDKDKKDELKRDLEGEVATFKERGTSVAPPRVHTFFVRREKKTIRARDVRRDLTGLKKPKSLTKTRLSNIRRKQKKLRKRMEGD